MSKLDAFLAKLAAKKRLLEREERRDRGEDVSDSDASDASDDAATDRPNAPAVVAPADAKSSASIYGSKAYWDARYATGCVIGANSTRGEVSNEWYVGYDAIAALLSSVGVEKTSSILVLGCGTSTLGEDLADAGFVAVTAVDYSENCIDVMRETSSRNQARWRADAVAAAGVEPDSDDDDDDDGGGYRAREDEDENADARPLSIASRNPVRYDVVDVTDMDAYGDGAFDVVLDKATLDTMCQLDDDPETEGSRARRMLRESCRVLRPGGAYVCVTYGDAEDRRGLLVDETLEWDVTPPTAAEVEEDVTGGGGGLGRVIRKNKAVFYAYVAVRR
jgi:SAM-dependent methyltransferase